MKLKSVKIVKLCLMIKIKFSQENFCIISVRSPLLWEKEGSGSGSASGSVLVTKGSGCGYGREPKNITTDTVQDADPEHCFVLTQFTHTAAKFEIFAKISARRQWRPCHTLRHAKLFMSSIFSLSPMTRDCWMFCSSVLQQDTTCYHRVLTPPPLSS